MSSIGLKDNTLQSGVIVEGVAKDSEAGRAGLQAGDVIQKWSRSEEKGVIKSPLDLTWVEAEQAPRGAVTLEGIRGVAKRTWKLGAVIWGLTARPELPEALLAIYRDGQQLVKDGKVPEGAARWRQGAAQARQEQLTSLWLQLQAAAALAAARQWALADEAYQQAIEQSGIAGPQIEARLWREWAATYIPRSDWERAENCDREALAKSQSGGTNNLGAAASLNLLGTINFYRGQLDEAEKYYRASFTMIEPLVPTSLDAAKALLNLGNVAATRGNLVEAEHFYHQSLAILQKVSPEGQDMAGVLVGLSKVSFDRGDLAQGKEFLRQSVAIQQRVAPHSLYLASSLTNLGLVALKRGELAQAEDYLRQGLAIREELAPGSLEVAQSITNLGAVALERGDLENAEKYLQEALAIQQRLAPGSLKVANTLNNLGDLARKRGNLAGAEDDHRRAIEIREKLAPESLDFAESLQSLGEVAQDAGDLAKAESYYRRSLAIRETVAPGTTMHAETLAALASVVKKKGDVDASAQLFEKALNVLEAQIARVGGATETHSGFRTRHLQYYLDYIDLLMMNHQPELAFHVVERSRARSLLEMLTEAHADIHTGVSPGLLAQERSLQVQVATRTNRQIQMLVDKSPEAKVTAVKKEIDELLSRYQEVEGEIRTSSPGYAALTQPQPLTASEVQRQLLDEDTLLLEYSLGEERSYVWVISRTGVTSHELSKRSEIETAAQHVYDLLTARNRSPKGESRLQRDARVADSDSAYGMAATELSRLVLDPVAADIQQKRLLVVSDGALQYIPFALLPVARSSDGTARRTSLMVEHEIVNLPSASVLAALRHDATGRPKAPKMVAILADPVFSNEDTRLRALRKGLREKPTTVTATAAFTGDPLRRAAADVATQSSGGSYLPRLPFTQQEARAILVATPPGQGMAALGFDASRAKAISHELARYRVVHFATHGLLDNQHPELSGLVFSLFDKNGKHQNGFLEMEDIYNLNLPVDMVVLSACETGLGMNIKGEGLVGLTRGFMYAGASRVVASLWSVDDVATSELMKRFYNAMFHERLSPSSALRKAQLQMSQQKRWSNPYYWAAFVLQGEWKTTAQ